MNIREFITVPIAVLVSVISTVTINSFYTNKLSAIANDANSATQSLSPLQVQNNVFTASPRLHKITLEVSEPEDLKVNPGQAIAAGQIIADQSQERKRLLLKRSELNLSIKRVEAQKISVPQKNPDPDSPKPIPELLPLPDFSTAEYEAAINKSEINLKRAQEILSFKIRQIDYLRGIQGIDPAILEHESSQLSEVESNVRLAQSELDLTKGKLQTAINSRKTQEYQHQLNLTKRIEELNQSKSFYQKELADNQIDYQRQLLAYEKELREKDYQLTQLNLQLSSIDDKIAQLAVIRSPYGGQVKRIKYTGQSGNKLSVELSIIVGILGGNSDRNSPNSTSSNFSANPLSPATSDTSASSSEK